MALTWLANGGFSDVQPGILSLAQNQQMYDAAAPLKPKTWRIMAAWNYIAKQPDPGPAVASPPSYDTGDGVMYAPPTTQYRDWSTVDRCINNIIRQTGAEPLIMIGQNRPRYGGGAGTGGLFNLFGGFASLLSGGLFGALGAGATSKVTAQDYGDFAAEVAERYKPGGLGIAPDLRALGKGVTKYEGWNEPNSKLTWVKNVDVKMFYEYQQELYNSIKAVSGLAGSASTICIGSMTHVPQGGAWYGDGWVTEQEIDFIVKYHDLGGAAYYDAMGVHPYTTQDARSTGYAPDMLDNAIVQARAICDDMVAHGAGSKPVWVTEYGFTTAMCTEQEQADFHAQAIELFSDNFPEVTMYLVYCLRNSGTNPRAINQRLGAVDTDFRHKPLWDLLKSMSPQEAAFNLGVTLGVGATGVPGPSFANMNLPITLGIGMTAAERYARNFNVGVTLGIGMSAVEKYAAAMNVGVTLGIGMGVSGLTAAAMNVGVTVGIGMTGVEKYTAAMNLGVTVGIGMTAAEKYAAAMNVGVTLGVGMTGTQAAQSAAMNVGVTLGIGMSAVEKYAAAMNVGVTLGIGMTAKMSYDLPFSGSTKPSGGLDFGENNVVAVSSGTMQEGTTKTSVNGTYYSGWLMPDSMQTDVYTARANSGALQSGTSRGIGVVVAAADDGAGNVTKAVIGIMSQTTAAGSIILSWNGTAWTQRAAATGTGTSVGTSDDVGIRISESGGVYTYTLQKNQVDVAGVSWTDSGAVIGVPGKRWGPGFKRIRASGVQSPSPGVDEIWSLDA